MVAGLCAALLFLTKPHAIALFIALTLVTVILIVLAQRFSLSRCFIDRSFGITIFSAIVFYTVALLLIKNRINPSEIVDGLYSSIGWNLLTKPIKMMESLKDLLAMIIGHLTRFLFLYGVPVVVVVISTIQAFKNKDFKSFVFLLWGSVSFLAFFAMTLKFTSDFRESEHMMRLHGRYYFFVFPFFLVAFIVFLKKVNWSMLSAAAFILTNTLIGVSLITVFPVFFPSWGMYVDFPEWTWLNSFFPAYRNLLDPQGWTWWNAANIKMASTVLMMMLFLLGLYYAFSKGRSLYPYLLFFLLFSIIGNITTLRSQIGASNIAWQNTKEPLALIESTILDRKDRVMVIGPDLVMLLHLPFWMSYEDLHGAVLAPESYISDDTIPPLTKWVVLLDRYNVTAQMQLIRSDGLINIYNLAR
jgi:hypothetical protein